MYSNNNEKKRATLPNNKKERGFIIKKNKKEKRVKNEPLELQLLKDVQVISKDDIKQKHKHIKFNDKKVLHSDTESEDIEMMDERTTNDILNKAKIQQLEIENEESRPQRKDYFKYNKEELKQKSNENDFTEYTDAQSKDYDYQNDLMLGNMSLQDRELFDKFTNPMPNSTKNLSDLIIEKLQEHYIEKQNTTETNSSTESVKPGKANEKVIQVYKKLGLLLSRYKSGKLPKAFKIIPALGNWQEILLYTEPDQWTPHAVYQATRLFSSNLKPHLAQRFYSAVLLPHVRKDIAENKKLNVHLYAALRKSIYKPAAFFKGILLPLCEDGDCTLKEAIIFASVLAKTSLPVLHSSAVLLKLGDIPYSGANSIFIRTLLDKKYTLPYKVIDALVEHFCKFIKDTRELFVLWHQSLLVFVQRYKEELTKEQKEKLLSLIKVKSHHMISPEIYRELSASTCSRDDKFMMSN